MHHGIEAIDHVRPLDSIAARTQQGGHAELHVPTLASPEVVENSARHGLRWRCARGWSSALSAKVELRDFNNDREGIR